MKLAFSFSDVFKSLEWFHIEHPEIQIITEYGRSLISTTAIFLSKAEKVFQEGRRSKYHNPAGQTLSSDGSIVRKIGPRVTVEGNQGQKNSYTNSWTPVFSGDKLGGIEMIDQIQEGSLVAIHDAGAYVISMWSSHCNRRRPEVIGISKHPSVSLFLRVKGERMSSVGGEGNFRFPCS